jgi:hypothetical protein
MWIVDVTGDKPANGNPPWKRHRRLKPETPQGDVEAFLVELQGQYTAARATTVLDGVAVEILMTRRGRSVKRTFQKGE